jgi:hypothetical protein
VFNVEGGLVKSMGFRVIPASISSAGSYNDYCPAPLAGNDKESFMAKLNSLSPGAGFKISDQYKYFPYK